MLRTKTITATKRWQQRNLAAGLCCNCTRPRDGSGTMCKHCRDVKKRNHVKRTYKLTLAQVQEILDSQSGRCAICKDSFIGQRICVDHCHDTGRVRGLLCSGCNIKVGAVERIVKNGWADRILEYLHVPRT